MHDALSDLVARSFTSAGIPVTKSLPSCSEHILEKWKRPMVRRSSRGRVARRYGGMSHDSYANGAGSEAGSASMGISSVTYFPA